MLGNVGAGTKSFHKTDKVLDILGLTFRWSKK